MLTRSLFSKNTVAKRLYLAFILATIIPVSILGIVSFYQVNGELEEQAFSGLRKSSKDYGLRLIDRFVVAESALKLLENRIPKLTLAHDSAILEERIGMLFSHIVVSKPTGNQYIVGEQILLPTLSTDEQRVISLGRTVIKAVDEDESIALWIAIPQLGLQDHLLMARLKGDSIWEQEVLGANELLVYGENGQLWFSTAEHNVLPEELEQEVLSKSSGTFKWEDNVNGSVLAGFWHTPLRNMFEAPNAIIVQIQLEDIALSANAHFKSFYPPVIMLAVLVVLLSVTKLISRYLTPLSALQEATEKLVKGDFSYQVKVDSEDEFQSLANSFNNMTRHIQTQFDIQSTMGEIDRQILSVRDANEVVETAMTRLPETLGVDMMAIASIKPNSLAIEKLYFRVGLQPTQIVDKPSVLSHEDYQHLISEQNRIFILASSELPAYSYIRKIMQEQHFYYLVVPVIVNEQLTAIVGFAYHQLSAITYEVKNTARNFGDRIAVALSNAAWEEKLYNQAHYDGLTGLANRRVLNEYLKQAVARAKRDETNFCVLFIDLDRFKSINDSMGHAAGDNLLVDVAKRLENNCRETDLAVRVSGDEFVILLTEFDDKQASASISSHIAEKILKTLAEPYHINGQTLHISASIGIAIFPDDGNNPDAILEHADAAMYHAKSAGRANFHFYQSAMTSTAVENLKLENDLRQALDNNELVVYFQPKFDSEQEIVGAEALIRWMHPELGMVSPAKFIPIAEQSLLIIDIGRWVFEQCCDLINELSDKNLTIVPIAVNLSAVEFNRDDLISHLLGILDKTQTNPNYIELELTESVALTNKDICIQRMTALRESGMSLAMDDFGTGFSSLSYLQELPLNTLKIDQQFVRNIELGESSQAIVKAVMALAKGLSMSVVAEGVETPEQFNFLAENGCDFYQGYLLSKPISKVDFMAKLEAKK